MIELLLKHKTALWGAGLVLAAWALTQSKWPDWVVYSAFVMGAMLLIFSASVWVIEQVCMLRDRKIAKRMPFIEWRERARQLGWDFQDATVLKLLDAMREAAANGELGLWGRDPKSSVSELTKREPLLAISSEHWKTFQIASIELASASVNIDVISYKLTHEKGYADLHVDGVKGLRWLEAETTKRKRL